MDTTNIIEDSGVTARITATLVGTTEKDITVPLDVTGSAEATDFNLASQIFIPAGSPSGFVDLSVNADVIDEFDETVVVDIDTAAITNGREQGTQQVIVNIEDDDLEAEITLSVDTTNIIEDSGVTARITATLVGTTEKDITVPLDVTGSAEATDFNLPSQIFIPAGSPSGFVDLSVNADVIDEFDETVIVDIDTAAITNGREQGTQQVIVNIEDDDLEAEITLSVDTTNIIEDSGVTARITATLVGTTEKDITIPLDVTGSAEATDFNLASQIFIPAGSPSGFVDLSVNADVIDEFDETVIVDIDTAAITNGREQGTQQVIVNIEDDDLEAEITLSVDTTNIIEDSGVTARITATLVGTTEKDITVPLDVTGSAEATDFNLASQIFIPAGSPSGFVDLSVNADVIDEFDETVVVDIDTAAITNGREQGTQQVIVNIEDMTWKQKSLCRWTRPTLLKILVLRPESLQRL